MKDNRRTQSQIENRLSLCSKGVISTLRITSRSGRIVFRCKGDAFSSPRQAGIILGQDIWQDEWVMFNNEKGIPEIVSLRSFSRHHNIYHDKKKVAYRRLHTVDLAISHWLDKDSFQWLDMYAQPVFSAGEKEESDVEQVIAAGILAILGFLSGDKDLIKAGLNLAGVDQHQKRCLN